MEAEKRDPGNEVAFVHVPFTDRVFSLERVTTVLVPLGVETNKGCLPVKGIHECSSKHTYTDKIS